MQIYQFSGLFSGEKHATYANIKQYILQLSYTTEHQYFGQSADTNVKYFISKLLTKGFRCSIFTA